MTPQLVDAAAFHRLRFVTQHFPDGRVRPLDPPSGIHDLDGDRKVVHRLRQRPESECPLRVLLQQLESVEYDPHQSQGAHEQIFPLWSQLLLPRLRHHRAAQRLAVLQNGQGKEGRGVQRLHEGGQPREHRSLLP